jgi:hypothetical protein
MTMRNSWIAAALVCTVVGGTPVGAAAQDAAPAAQPVTQPSRMQVTQLKSGWLVAPNVKFTNVDDHAATFAGGYGGWVTEGTFLVGGGGYWLANGSDDLGMAYGGLVLEWLARSDKRVGFGARTLIGGGSASVGLSYTDLYGPITPVVLAGDPVRFGHHGQRRPRGFDPGLLADRSFRVSENFFIAEPQANVLLTLTDWMRINAGVGYRLIGGTSLLDDRLHGASGTVALQFGARGN